MYLLKNVTIQFCNIYTPLSLPMFEDGKQRFGLTAELTPDMVEAASWAWSDFSHIVKVSENSNNVRNEGDHWIGFHSPVRPEVFFLKQEKGFEGRMRDFREINNGNMDGLLNGLTADLFFDAQWIRPRDRGEKVLARTLRKVVITSPISFPNVFALYEQHHVKPLN